MGKASRRKRATSGQVMRRSDRRKLSECLIDVIEPFHDEDLDREAYANLVTLAATAWNLSVFPNEEREPAILRALSGGATASPPRYVHARKAAPREERATVPERSSFHRQFRSRRRKRRVQNKGGFIFLCGRGQCLSWQMSRSSLSSMGDPAGGTHRRATRLRERITCVIEP
jgi:hypothetical protein